MNQLPVKSDKERTSMCEELLIEGEDACCLAAELADLTGESLQAAVIGALREGIAREHARLARQERIMAITREIARSARYSAGSRQMATH